MVRSISLSKMLEVLAKDKGRGFYMLNFLDISKKNITRLDEITLHLNAHFITDTSQSWIISNVGKEEGVCDLFIHYVSPDNNKKMMEEQPLWRGYLNNEVQDEKSKKEMMKYICEPIIHVILNIHQSYKDMIKELIPFIQGVLKKHNPQVEEIVIETFIYTEMLENE